MLNEYFAGLTDTRQAKKVKHNLLEIIVMTICAVIAGCEAWEDIADYCRVKQDWFQSRLGMKLQNGVPSHDTLQRVWGMIEPKEFEKCFRSWIRSVCTVTGGEIVSIDGKTLNGSKDAKKSAIHMVSAWANKNQLVIGQISTEEKSNEITAVPQLLDLLDVKGCIITADAMSCQKKITAKIEEKQADYVLALKDNQLNLRRDGADFFDEVLNHPKELAKLQHTHTIDKGHGRIETRDYYLTTDIDWMLYGEGWHNLKSIGIVISNVESGGKKTTEKRYYISSLTSVQSFSKAVRSHWGIENSLHWCLDVTFHEDDSRMRKDNTAENMAVVRHFALDALKLHPAKMSIARKKRHCSYDAEFLAQVLEIIHA